MGFKVIIVGGSVSGLSLASMLEKFNIDYILLEAHTKIAPQLGASLGLLPAGLRILDQLGCYDKIRENVGNTYYAAQMRLFSGKTWIDPKPITFSETLEERIGYPQTFVDRQTVIQVLFDSLEHKERVLTSKRVNIVEHGENNVTVHTKDGSKYTGDIVVGADGIHSSIRKEMWRIANEAKSDLFKPDPLARLQCESKCIFGISKRPPGLPTSPQQINAFFKNSNYMIISAPGDRYYWFLFTEVDKVYGKDIPAYTKEDERKLAEEHFGDQVTETTTFKDLYEHRLQTALVSIEDHVFPHWYYRRIITIGDAAHKLHPISAQGGNGAMETAAVLVNNLVAALQDQDAKKSLTECDIDAIFADVQATRYQRAVDAMNQGRHTNSASIKETFFSKIFVDHFFPRFGQSLILKLIIKNTMTGPCIERLPLPERYTTAIERHQKRNPKKNWTVWGLMSLGASCLFAFMCLRLRDEPLHDTSL
ncbi:FAD binding domain-containing protein [Fusarium sporotrichioides]|uniref:FAD binding domain-containing protein n=1 Tax=Fusarium sporotrichioides TaxID=5514 RepID=A0A395RR67_FUSSP|nr:FAD binding domain-containing protein [Fusarium sporotrichioides]